MTFPSVLVALAAVSLPALAFRASAQTGPVKYDIDLTRSREQLIRVKMTLDGITTPSVDVHLPVWRPGLYLILDQAGTVRTMQASASGNPLTLEKVEKSSWRISTGGASTVTVEYDVWAASLDNRTRHADDTHAFFNPATVLLYAHEWRTLPVDLSLTLPQAIDDASGWEVASGMAGQRTSPSTWSLTAPSYDVMADSPVEAGIHHAIPFDVDGVPHEIIIWTGEPSRESSRTRDQALKWDRLAEDFAKIVRAQRDIFGKLPYDKYSFLIHCYPGARGGTEHYNSTIMQTPPEAIREDERYRSFLLLTSHEFFHTWNIKRFRPATLAPYDYQRENLTDLLWVAEGSTTYYESVALARAGLLSRPKFFSQLATDIDGLRNRPGAQVQSVAHASYDAWTKFNKRTADAANSTVSFYDKGALVSFLLDMEIRKRKPDASLDTVMRRLFEKFPTPDKGFTEADLKQLIADASGDNSWIDEFFRTAVHGTAPLDFASALDVVGYKLEEQTGPAKPYLGVTVVEEAGVLKVATVATDSPALSGPPAAPGLVPGDVVVALGGRRIRAADWDKEIGKRSPGDEVVIHFFRFDVLRELRTTLGSRADVTSEIRRVSEPTDEQKAALDAWLGAR